MSHPQLKEKNPYVYNRKSKMEMMKRETYLDTWTRAEP